MTVASRILDVARTLPPTFSVADLVVAAWESDPESFGLAGYRHKYPAAHTVFSKLYGSSGLIARGLLAWSTPVALHITDQGRSFVALEPRTEEETDALDLLGRVQRLMVENALLRRQLLKLRANASSRTAVSA